MPEQSDQLKREKLELGRKPTRRTKQLVRYIFPGVSVLSCPDALFRALFGESGPRQCLAAATERSSTAWSLRRAKKGSNWNGAIPCMLQALSKCLAGTHANQHKAGIVCATSLPVH